MNIDVSESIVKCREDGFKDEDIIIDVILCFGQVARVDQWKMKEIKYKNAFEMYKRTADLKDFYYYFEDILRVVRGYPNVQFRHLISPLEDLDSGFFGGGIFADPEQMNRFLERGAEDAAAHIKYYYEKTGDKRIGVFEEDANGIPKWQ